MISENDLCQALEEIDTAILAALPLPSECMHQFSSRFVRKMRTVKYRAKHPVVYKTVQRAACILLAVLILFCSVASFSTSVRAAVLDWIKAKFEIFYSYFSTETPRQGEHSHFQLDWLPEGYEYTDSYSTDNSETTIYCHGSGNLIQFSYMYSTSANPLYVGGKEYEHKIAQSNGQLYDIYTSMIDDENNWIVWQDSEQGVLFSISAPCDEDTLIKIAKNISKK